MPTETPTRSGDGLEDIELSLLLDGLYRHYGLDFRDYARASLRRRIRAVLADEGLASISALQERVLHDADARENLVEALSVRVTAMFRDPSFYVAFQSEIVPMLRTYPFIRVWHAGCSTGEEVYSMAILLDEAGIYDRTMIYATDMSERVLATARAGQFLTSSMRENTANFMQVGFRAPFSDFYVARRDHVLLRADLRRNVVFARHNLATDGSFNDFHVILCRNVMIYFNSTLQARVHRLFYDSLVTFGYLGLGNRESVRFTPHEQAYQTVSEAERLYRKVR